MLVVLSNIAFLLLPALVNRFEAPFGRALARANRLAVYQHKDGVGVARGENSQTHPAAGPDRHVESNVLFGAVGNHFFSIDSLAVDDYLHRHATGLADARSFDVPVRLGKQGRASNAFGRFGGFGLEKRRDARGDLDR